MSIKTHLCVANEQKNRKCRVCSLCYFLMPDLFFLNSLICLFNMYLFFHVFSFLYGCFLLVPLLCVCVNSASKSRSQNDLYCVEWDVKPYWLTHTLFASMIAVKWKTWERVLCVLKWQSVWYMFTMHWDQYAVSCLASKLLSVARNWR